MMQLVRNQHGVILDPEFHDGLLLGIVMSPSDKSLTVHCQTIDKEDCRLTIPQIVRLRADDFRQGNIIFEMTLREGPEVPEEAVRKLWQFEGDMAAKHLATLMRKIQSDRWILFEIGSSYGCELLAVSQGSIADVTWSAAAPVG
jgi:hypothetical protein